MSRPLSAYKIDDDADLHTITLDFERPRKPWRKVALAIFLLLAGFAMLVTGCVLYLTNTSTASGIPLIVIGCVLFIPGFYHTRIAYLSWRGYRGYTLDDIPDV